MAFFLAPQNPFTLKPIYQHRYTTINATPYLHKHAYVNPSFWVNLHIPCKISRFLPYNLMELYNANTIRNILSLRQDA